MNIRNSAHFLFVFIVIALSIHPSLEYKKWNVVSTSADASVSSYFSVGIGGSDLIPRQVVRTNTDRLYIFANQQSSKVIRVYRTTGAGLPENALSFSAPIQLTETSNPISVDAVYDGGNIIHVLVNMQNSAVKDYPFNVTTNTFNSPISLATNGGTVTSGLYVGTSGVTGMIDLNGSLQVTYWTDGNHVLHRAYTYNSSTNALTPLGDFVQIDTAGNANHPSIAISPVDNSLTVAWISQADNPPKIRARVRMSNGIWGSVQSVSSASVWTSTDNGINIDQGPSLIVDSAGVKHLTYIQSFDGTVGDYGRIHYITDSGSGWLDQALNSFTHDPVLAINSAAEIYIIGHGHPKNSTCLSMLDMCIIKKNSNGTWGNPQLFAAHPGGNSFDSSPSVKWSVVGFNRPEVIEFIFFMTPYDNPTLYYGRIQSSMPSPTISGNAGVAGATLSYTDGTPKTAVADGSGNYTITVPTGWSGTVTPSKVGYCFSPVYRTYGNVISNKTAQNYTTSAHVCTVQGDYNGDGKKDIAVFRPSNSTWYINGVGPFVYGTAGDIPVSADYNGDGKTDIAVFRPSNSTWYIYGVGPFVYGTSGDIPVVADYNGDGKADIAVFRPSNSTWYIYGVGPFVYGAAGDIPVVADYNGDGKADIAVFRPTNSTWYIYGVGPSVYGTVGDTPVVADYNGDGKADIAVFRPTNSTWYIYGVGPSVYGAVGDTPVVGDYNGDGKADIAVFRPTNSTWYIYGVGPSVFGTVGDIPV